MFKLPYNIQQIFRQIGIDFKNIHIVRISVGADVGFDRNEAVEFFLLGRLARFFAIKNAVVDQRLENVIKPLGIDLYAVRADIITYPPTMSSQRARVMQPLFRLLKDL